LAAMTSLRDETALGILIVVGALVYAVCILSLFGRRWLMTLVRR
jgi:putative peptidoglycan lipid II flippase